MVWIGIALTIPIILFVCAIVDTNRRAKKAKKIASELLPNNCDKELENAFNNTNEQFKLTVSEYFKNLENEFKKYKPLYDNVIQDYILFKNTIKYPQQFSVKLKGELANYYCVKNDDNLVLCKMSCNDNEKLLKTIEELFNLAKNTMTKSNVNIIKKDKATICCVLSRLKSEMNNFKHLCTSQNFRDKLLIKVNIEEMLYYEVQTEVKTYTKTEPSGFSTNNNKKPSKIGTAINEALFGTAYATAKAMQNIQSKETNTVTTSTSTKHTATIYFNEKTGIPTLETVDIDKLIVFFPEKRRG